MRVANNGILYSIGDTVRFIHKNKTLEDMFKVLIEKTDISFTLK